MRRDDAARNEAPLEWVIVVGILLVLFLMMLLTASAGAGDLEPFPLPGGWWSCPVGTLIHHHRCLPTVEGPVVEYGCTVTEDSAGVVVRQSCPSTSTLPWVGNVGSRGVAAGFASPSGFGIVVLGPP